MRLHQKTATLPLFLMATDLRQSTQAAPSLQVEPETQPERLPLAPLLIGVDLGGTHTRAAVVRDGEIIARVRRSTPAQQGPDAVIACIVAAVREVLQEASITLEDVRGVGISAPGPLSPQTGIVYDAPNLAGWHDVPLRDEVVKQLKTIVHVGHDATLAGLAEMRFGAGRGARDMIYMTVSTGIGGGIFVGERIIDGVSGTGGEIGHMYLSMNADAPRCGSGHIGCLEAFASGTALARDANALVTAGKGAGIVAAHQHRIAEADADAREETAHLAARDVVIAAHQGDAEALALLDAAGTVIGVGCANLVHIFNTARIVIGGGMANNAGDLLFQSIQTSMKARAFARPASDVTIVPATLEDDGGLIGAAIYVDYQQEHGT